MNQAYLITHLSPNQQGQDYRFDTLISPSGTVAALSNILHQHGVYDEQIYAFDQGVDDFDIIKQQLCSIIDELLKQHPGIVIYCLFTVLLYNSQPTYQLTHELRQQYGNQLSIVLGGQHLTNLYELTKSYQFCNHRSYDHLLLGDGELQLPDLINKQAPKTSCQLYTKSASFSTMRYNSLVGLRQRLEKQQQEAGFTQICWQGSGGPGCSRAMNNKDGQCKHCALQHITTANTLPLQQNLQEQFEQIQRIYQRTNILIDRIFMVDNQFLPHQTEAQNTKRLQEYINIKHQLSEKFGFNPGYYIYLTELSIRESYIQLLAQLGVQEVYIGFDHLHPTGLIEQNKGSSNRSSVPQEEVITRAINSIKSKLDLLKTYHLKVRWGNVLGGSSETQETLGIFYPVIERATDPQNGYIVLNPDGTINRQQSTILAIGVFPFEVLPGAPFFTKFWNDIYDDTQVQDRKDEALTLMKHLQEFGYRDRSQQLHAQELYIRRYSQVSYKEIVDEKQKITDLLQSRGLIGYSVDESPDGESLKF